MNRIYSLILRYLVLLATAFPNLWIFYAIFTPLTIYPSFFALNLFYNAFLFGDTILLEGVSIHLVEACIAGSAYYLLLILNLTTPMPPKKRAFSLGFSFLSFLIINILRIIIFSALLLGKFSLFNLLHLVAWYFMSGVLVFLIWIAEIKIFKIEKIPVYSDLKFLVRLTKKSK